MPCPPAERYELQDLAVTPNQQVRRHPEFVDFAEVGMDIRIQVVGEQGLDERPAKFSWRQADAVNNDQVGLAVAGSFILIRRRALDGWPQEAGARTYCISVDMVRIQFVDSLMSGLL